MCNVLYVNVLQKGVFCIVKTPIFAMQKYGFCSVKVWFLQCKNVLIVFH